MSITLYGSSISYFTGKMENYFRIREIPYVFKSMQFPSFKKEMENQVGVMQMPAVVLEDGCWMTDTTKMIQWFEDQIRENKTVPKDPVQAFICYLLFGCAQFFIKTVVVDLPGTDLLNYKFRL